MIVGNDRTGKTSLKKHLLGLDFNTEEPSTNGIEVDMVEITAEDAKDPWKIKDKKFFTSAEEAEEEILKSTAQYVMKQKKLDPENNTESNGQGYPNLETLNIPEAEENNATSYKDSKPETTVKTVPLSQEKIARIDNLQIENIHSEQPEPVRVFIHDFAGQSIFYDTHFCFLKTQCPYLLVVDLSVGLENPAHSRFKFKSVDVERKLNDPLLETNFDYLLSWLTVLERLGDFYQEVLEGEDLEFKLPPVVIVLTNADKFKGKRVEAVRKIEELLHEKAFQNVLPDIFLIDNTSRERNGGEIRKLRELLYQLCTSILKEQPLMPVRWLQFEGILSNMMLEKGVKHISVEDARAAAKSCNVDNADAAMRFLHHQGIIVHHSESPVVVLNPPWLINLFTKIITVPEKRIPKDAPFYKLMMNKGILKQDYIQREVGEKLLEDLMKQFSLICPWKFEGESVYIVPSVAPLMDEGEDIQERLSTNPVSPVFIDFNWSYVPLGFFTRLQTNMINNCREDLLTIPLIFCNYTLLSFGGTKGEFDVYLIKIPGKIKVGVVSRSIFNPQACGVFVNFLRKALENSIEYVKDEESLIYRNVVASLVVKCSVCCGKTEECRLRHTSKVKCGRDECGHFWPLSDLQDFDSDPVCPYIKQTTVQFPLDCVKFWLSKGNSRNFIVLN